MAVAKRRTVAHVRDGLPNSGGEERVLEDPLRTGVLPHGSRDVNAGGRKHFGISCQIESGHGLLGSHAAARHHVALQRVMPFQQAGGLRDPASFDQLP